MIAKFTGWTEQFILWDLPMARGNAYCHAFMRLENVNTEPANADEDMIRMIDEI